MPFERAPKGWCVEVRAWKIASILLECHTGRWCFWWMSPEVAQLARYARAQEAPALQALARRHIICPETRPSWARLPARAPHNHGLPPVQRAKPAQRLWMLWTARNISSVSICLLRVPCPHQPKRYVDESCAGPRLQQTVCAWVDQGMVQTGLGLHLHSVLYACFVSEATRQAHSFLSHAVLCAVLTTCSPSTQNSDSKRSHLT